MERIDAIEKAVRNFQRWMGGARVVVNEEGEYDAIPGAYLNDISYTGSRDVDVAIDDISELGNPDLDTDAGIAECAAWLNETIPAGAKC